MLRSQMRRENLVSHSQGERVRAPAPTDFREAQLLDHYLTIQTFLPLLGAIVIAFLRRESAAAIRWTALIFSLGALALAVGLFLNFSGETGMQFVEDHPWISSPPIRYHLGVDGL